MADVSFGPFLVKYLRSRKVIYMLYPVYGLARSYTVGIVGIRILSRAVVADYMREPAPLRPCKRAIITGKYIVQRRERPVVGDASTASPARLMDSQPSVLKPKTVCTYDF